MDQQNMLHTHQGKIMWNWNGRMRAEKEWDHKKPKQDRQNETWASQANINRNKTVPRDIIVKILETKVKRKQ